MSPSAHSRPNRVLALLCVAAVATGGAAVLAWRLAGSITGKSIRNVQTATVVKGHLDRFLHAHGELHYVESVAVRCTGTREQTFQIVNVVPEWSQVQAGDVVMELDDQTTKRQIFAPESARVVYADAHYGPYVIYFDTKRLAEIERYRSQNYLAILAGGTARGGQIIGGRFDTGEMQVRARVKGASIRMVKPGMPVTIRVSKLPDQPINGEVIKVNQYAEPNGPGPYKLYGVDISVFDPPTGLRSRMLADVQILVARERDVPQIPAEAVVQHQGRFFCLARVGEKYETRELQIRSIIGKTATIEQGLTFDDVVVANPWEAGHLFDLP
jgi:hypothetical protein